MSQTLQGLDLNKNELDLARQKQKALEMELAILKKSSSETQLEKLALETELKDIIAQNKILKNGIV